MKVAVIISIVSLSNSDILNSKWQIVTLLLSFIKFLIRAASENFRSACYLWFSETYLIDFSASLSIFLVTKGVLGFVKPTSAYPWSSVSLNNTSLNQHFQQDPKTSYMKIIFGFFSPYNRKIYNENDNKWISLIALLTVFNWSLSFHEDNVTLMYKEVG